MYSLSARFNKIFFFGLFNLIGLCLINYGTGLLFLRGKYINAHFDFQDHHQFKNFHNPTHRIQWDSLMSTFNLDVSRVEGLNNWNVKQLFFYLEAVWDEKGKRFGEQKRGDLLGQNRAAQRN